MEGPGKCSVKVNSPKSVIREAGVLIGPHISYNNVLHSQGKSATKPRNLLELPPPTICFLKNTAEAVSVPDAGVKRSVKSCFCGQRGRE